MGSCVTPHNFSCEHLEKSSTGTFVAAKTVSQFISLSKDFANRSVPRFRSLWQPPEDQMYILLYTQLEVILYVDKINRYNNENNVTNGD